MRGFKTICYNTGRFGDDLLIGYEYVVEVVASDLFFVKEIGVSFTMETLGRYFYTIEQMISFERDEKINVILDK